MSPQREKRTAMFLRVYSWVFCAALWLVVLACVLGAVSNSGEDRPPFLFFTVIVGSMALKTSRGFAVATRPRLPPSFADSPCPFCNKTLR